MRRSFLGGAVMGSLVATDRRTSGAQLEDEGIELRASSRIRENLGDRVHVNVTSYNRQVLLTGEVPSAQDKQLVEQIVSRVDNVRAVVNELAVLGTSSADPALVGRADHRQGQGRPWSTPRICSPTRSRSSPSAARST